MSGGYLVVFCNDMNSKCKRIGIPRPPHLKKRINRKPFFWFSLKRPKTSSKSCPKKTRFGIAAIFYFRRIPELCFSMKPRQSLPLVRFREGSATLKVVQTKTQLGRGSIMSAPDAGSAAAVTKPGNCDRSIVFVGKDKHVIKHSCWLHSVPGKVRLVTTLIDNRHRNARSGQDRGLLPARRWERSNSRRSE